MRSRSIYSTRVYTADLSVSGSFKKVDLTGLRPHIAAIHWDRASLVVGLSATKAIRDASELELAGKKLNFQPGTGRLQVLSTGFSALNDFSQIHKDGVIPFRFQVSVGGSNGLFFTPVGIVSRFKLSSDWPHPSFGGSGLPTTREIRPNGFTAEWEIPNLVRNYPQFGDVETWLSSSETRYSQQGQGLDEYVVGVNFFEPIFYYSLLLRAVKYAVLFISLTFLGVVILEHYARKRGGVRLSMLQYCVIGIGLSLFYLTLLAVSEHLGFTWAYVLAAVVNVLMTGSYILAALRARRPALLAAGGQGLLYAMLFFILRLEDYALLAGTALLILATVALMVVTRDLNRPIEQK
jgi:inner membrane protein